MNTKTLIIFLAMLFVMSIIGCGSNTSPSPPSAPTGVTATPGNGQITLAWTAVPSATSYNIYWSTATGVTPTNGTKITSATNPYVHLPLAVGITYYYVVTAVNSAGESATSTQASAVPQPYTPTNVTATTGNGQITLAWTAAPGATSYNIYWSTTTGVTPTNGTKIPGATNPYIHTPLTIGITYYYVVTAVSTAGESAASTQVSAVPQPSTPTNVTATPVVGTTGEITISWTPVAGATSYNIYLATPNNGITVPLFVVPPINVITNTYTQTGLTSGLTYYYQVTAIIGNGESPRSTQVSAVPF